MISENRSIRSKDHKAITIHHAGEERFRALQFGESVCRAGRECASV